MQARPHRFFYRSQCSVSFDLPNDVFFDVMALTKRINLLVNTQYPGYKITPDEIFTMSLEDFCARYVDDVKSLFKRIEGK